MTSLLSLKVEEEALFHIGDRLGVRDPNDVTGQIPIVWGRRGHLGELPWFDEFPLY